MRKLKWLFMICAMVVLIGIGRTDVQAEDLITEDGFEYFISSPGEIEIVNYHGSAESIIIPAEIDGKKVKSVYLKHNENRDIIKHVTISEGILSLDNFAFKDYHNLETVILPDSLNAIGAGAFLGCSNLKTINLPENLTELDYDTFKNCTSLKTIVLSNNITSIETDAFSNCSSLETVILPHSLTIICGEAFLNCSKLNSIVLPDSLTEIRMKAFYGCTSLKKLIIPDSVTEISFRAFLVSDYKQDGQTNYIYLDLYGNPGSYAQTYASKYGLNFSCLEHKNIITDAGIPATCTKTGTAAGSYCTDCQTVISGRETIPAKGHTWDNGTIIAPPSTKSNGTIMYFCTACGFPKTETLPPLGQTGTNPTPGKPAHDLPKKGSICRISGGRYKVTKSDLKNGTVECMGISSSKVNFTIPNTVIMDGVTYKVTSIGKNAFKNNKKLKKVTIGSNITTIGSNAFYGCKNLINITVKSTKIKSVGKNAFKGVKANAKIKVPKSKLSDYQKKFKKKGQKSTVKITK